MPWCGSCEHYFAPSAVKTDGSCPQCGASVDPGPAKKASEAADDAPRMPWHLKLLLAAVALYLGWRAWEGIVWVAGRF